MDEGTGSTTKDDAASNTGTITGATWKSDTDCKRGNCLYFDGDDRVTTSAFALSGTVLTVSGWVKMGPNATIHQAILGDDGGSATVGGISLYRVWTSSDSLLWIYADGSTLTNTSMLTFFTGYDNTWVHFAVVCDYSGKTTKFYRNGELIQTTAMTGTPIFPSTSGAKYLGANNSSIRKIQNGNLDDVRIYNRELSAAEIKALYEGTK
jgi:hypothetical protein